MSPVPPAVAATSEPTSRRAVFLPAPLTTWQETWRWLVTVTASLLLLVLGSSNAAFAGRSLGLDVLLGVVAFGAFAVRRRWPLLAGAVACLAGSFSMTGVPPSLVVLMSVATRRRWREMAALGVGWVSLSVVYDRMTSGMTPAVPWWGLMIVTLLVYGIVVAVGSYVGARRELVATLRTRAETAEREQAARVDQARAEERTRIAREMHDVLAHRISLVAMHSGALAYRTDLGREETAQTAAIIRDNANLALKELREVLGVLRDLNESPSSTTPERPQPLLGDIHELVTSARSAGTTVALDIAPEVEEALPGLSGAVSRAAYRIVQEALTNTRKHAPGMPVDVSVGRTASPDGDDRLTIEVLNALPAARPSGKRAPTDGPPSSGLGLTGLAERASLAGGELRHGPDRSGRYVVAAWLPWS